MRYVFLHIIPSFLVYAILLFIPIKKAQLFKVELSNIL
ncbi:hypothetical protein JCM19302_141 [Jejuia pallidilutea]|uniref:Uncharacterized protein n=1 Tax=Jejuia pallidilutea TaxID=504487 RepID=A0A090W7I4_9FLAO|nr:hypothetical protein JCM19302_141 [Jejuia pallidilutea]GAL90770.1 hypothetical protein JCM19538_535 [Jejuia pallidilutea]